MLHRPLLVFVARRNAYPPGCFKAMAYSFALIFAFSWGACKHTNYEENNNPLSEAIEAGDTNAVHNLILNLNEKQINEPDSSTGLTPLMAACLEGNTSIVRDLLERHADPNKTVSAKQTSALHIAAQHKSPQVVSLLLEHGGMINAGSGLEIGTPLMSASKFGNVEVVRTLLERGADPDAYSSNGYGALHTAAMGGDVATIKLLLETGSFDVDSDKMSPLMFAVYNRKVEATKYLLSKGANVSLTTPNGMTALHIAANTQHASREIIQILLVFGANPMARDNAGKTPLDYAKSNDYGAFDSSIISLLKTVQSKK